jgi:poly(3-hydroxybutyrate) depolymerase
MGAGHYGIFSGRRWREDVYPQVRDFIATHQLHKAAPPTRVRPPARAAARSKQPSAAAPTQLTLVDAAPSTPPVQHVAAVKQVASALKAVARTSRASTKTTAVTLAPTPRKAAAPKLTLKAKASVESATKAAVPISAARKAVPKTPRAK